MAVNAASYIKNLGKSVSYSAVDKVKEMNPTLKNMAEANSDLTKTLFKTIKNSKAIARNLPNTIRQNEYYKIAKQGIGNALEDLKTGKLYNKEREEQVNESMLGLDSLDSDFDINDDDYNFEDFDLSSLDDGDRYMSDMIDEVGSKVTTGVASSVYTAAQYNGEVTKASTKLLYDQNAQYYGAMTAGLGTISVGIQQILSQQEALQAHMENSKTFFERSVELDEDRNKILLELLELQKATNTMISSNKSNKETFNFSDIDDGMGGVDIVKYLRNIKKNANAKFGTYLDSLHMFDGHNMLETMISSPLKAVTDGIVKVLVPKALDDASKDFNESLKGLFGSFVARINTLADSDNGMDNILYDLLHVGKRSLKRYDVSKYNKGPMPWNGVANKALVEVIPNQLSEIISLISGTQQKLFDYESGKFITRDEVIRTDKDRVSNSARNASRDVMDEVKGMMQEISFSNKDFKNAISEGFQSMFESMFKNGKLLDIYDPDFKNKYSEYGVNDPKVFKYMTAMLKEVSNSAMLNLNTNMLEARDKFNADMDRRMREGSSIDNYLLNNSSSYDFSAYEKNGKKKKEKSTKSLLRKYDRLALHNQVEQIPPHMRSSIRFQLDNKGNNVFDYLQSITKELMYIRKNSGFYGAEPSSANKNVLFTSRGPVIDRSSSKRVGMDSIELEDKFAKIDKERFDREMNTLTSYEAKINEEREKNTGIFLSEDFDRVVDDDIELQKLFSKTAIRSRYKDGDPKVPKKLSLVDKLLLSKNIGEKTRVIVDSVNELSKKPAQMLSSAMESADKALYTLIYGDNRDEDGKHKSFSREMIDQMKFQFTKLNAWIDDTILNPIKDKIGVNQFRDVPKKIFAMFGIDLDETWKNFKEYIFGAYEVDANGVKRRTQDGLLTPIQDGIKDAFKDTGNYIKDAFKEVFAPVIERFKGKKKDPNKQQEVTLEDIVDESQNVSSSANNILQQYRNINMKDPMSVGLAYDILPSVGGFETADDYYKYIAQNKSLLSNRAKRLRSRKQHGYKVDSYDIDRANRQLEAIELLERNISGNETMMKNVLGLDPKTSRRLAQSLAFQKMDSSKTTMNELYSMLSGKGENQYGILAPSIKGGKTLKGILDENTSYGDMTVEDFKRINNMKMYPYEFNNPTTGFQKAIDRQVRRGTGSKYMPSRGKFTGTRAERQSMYENLFGGKLPSVTDASTEIIDTNKLYNVESKSEKHLKDILGLLRRKLSTPSLPTPDLDIDANLAEGGVFKPKGGRKVGLAVLSEGEVVYNPASDKEKAKQNKKELDYIDYLSEIYDSSMKNLPNYAYGGPVDRESIERAGYEFTTDEGVEYYRVGNDYFRVGDESKAVYYPSAKTGHMVKLERKGRRKGFISRMDIKGKFEAAENGEYEKNPLIVDMYTTLMSDIKSASSALGIDEKGVSSIKEATKDVMTNMEEYLPSTIGHGTVGLVAGTLLGGPLVGAVAGASIGLVKKSKKIQDMLFGETDEEGNYKGGFISADIVNGAKKYLPTMAKYGTVGGILGLVSPLGIVGSTLVGSAIGFAKNNEEVMSSFFGDNYKENFTKVKETIAKKLPSIALGAVGGALFGPLNGFIPNIMLGSALGFAKTTNKFKDFLFGVKRDDGTRTGGIFGTIKNGLIDPIKDNARDFFEDLKHWVRKDILHPVKNSLDPLVKQSFLTIGRIFGVVTDKLTHSMDRGFSAVLSAFFRDKVFNPTMKRIGAVGKAVAAPAKAIISSPFRAIGAIGTHYRGKHINQGNATYMTAQERLDFREDRDKKKGLLNRLGFIKRHLKDDKFREFDEFLVDASDEELAQMNENFSVLTDGTDYYNKEKGDALKDIREQIYGDPEIGYTNARQIMKALETEDWERVNTIIDNMDVDDYTRQKVKNTVFKRAAKLTSLREISRTMKHNVKAGINKLRRSSSGVFKGLKKAKDIDKYQKYLKNEMDTRAKKTDVEIQTEQDEKHHEQLMDTMSKVTNYLRILATPDAETRKRLMEDVENRHRAKIARTINKKAGFSLIDAQRKEGSKVWDTKKDANGKLVLDDYGNPIYEYVGAGSETHRRLNPGLYDAEGNLKEYTKYNKKQLIAKHSASFATEDLMGLSNIERDEARRIISEAADENGLTDFDVDEYLSKGPRNKQDTASFLRRSNFTQMGHKKRRNFLNSINRALVSHQIKSKYRLGGMDDQTATIKANDMIDGEEGSYMFDGIRRFKMKYDPQNGPQIDTEDATTGQYVEEIKDAEKAQKESTTLLRGIKESTSGFFKKFLGVDQEKGDEPLWKKGAKFLLGKMGGVMGAWTLLSLAPYAKKAWENTVAPWLGKHVGEPLKGIAPQIVDLAARTDNFLLNTLPNKAESLFNKGIDFLLGQGEYEGKGLPGIFTNNIIPFYLGGLEFLIEDIVPNAIKLLGVSLPTILKSSIKAFADIMSWNVRDIFNGTYTNVGKKVIISNKEYNQKVDANKSNTKKTGIFYNMAKSVFGTSGTSSNSVGTTSETIDYSGNVSGYDKDGNPIYKADQVTLKDRAVNKVQGVANSVSGSANARTNYANNTNTAQNTSTGYDSITSYIDEQANQIDYGWGDDQNTTTTNNSNGNKRGSLLSSIASSIHSFIYGKNNNTRNTNTGTNQNTKVKVNYDSNVSYSNGVPYGPAPNISNTKELKPIIVNVDPSDPNSSTYVVNPDDPAYATYYKNTYSKSTGKTKNSDNSADYIQQYNKIYYRSSNTDGGTDPTKDDYDPENDFNDAYYYDTSDISDDYKDLKDGEATLDANGDLVYNLDGNIVGQSSDTGELFLIKDNGKKSYGKDQKITANGKTMKLSDIDFGKIKEALGEAGVSLRGALNSSGKSIMQALKATTQPGTIANTSLKAFLTARSNPLTNLIVKHGGVLPHTKGLSALITAPVNFVSNSAARIVQKSGQAGQNFFKGLTNFDKWVSDIANGKTSSAASNVAENITTNGNIIRATNIIDDAANAGVRNASTRMVDIVDSSGNVLSRVAQNSGDDITSGITRGLSNSADNIAARLGKEAAEAATDKGLKSGILKKLLSIFKNTTVLKILGKLGSNFTGETLQKAAEKIASKMGTKLGERLAKAGAAKALNLASKVVSKFSPLALISIGADFIRGFRKAKEYMGLDREATLGEKVVSGLVSVVNGYVTFGLIPEDWIFSIFIEVLGPALGIKWAEELYAERLEKQNAVDEYNEKYGTDYSLAEYAKLSEEDKKKVDYSNTLSSIQTSLRQAGVTKDSTSDQKVKAIMPNLELSDYQKKALGMGSGLPSVGTGTSALRLAGMGSSLPVGYSAGTYDKEDNVYSGSFISQTNPMYASRSFNISTDSVTQTVGQAGCAPAVASMVVDDVIHGVESANSPTSYIMNDAIDYALNTKYKENNGGIRYNYFEDYFNKYGLKTQTYTDNKSIEEEIDNGSRLVLLGQDPSNKSKAVSPFGKTGHYVSVNGVSKDKKYVYVNDPESNVPNIKYSIGKLMKGTKLAVKATPINASNTYNSVQGSGSKEETKTIFNDPNLAILHADLCSFSTISKSTMKSTLNKFLKAKKVTNTSKLKGKSDIFLIASVQSDFDPRFLLALALHNTDYGTNKFATNKNNPFRIMNNKGKYVKFASIEDGIIEGAKWIKGQVYCKGRYSLIQMVDSAINQEFSGAAFLDDLAHANSVAALMLDSNMPENTKLQAAPVDGSDPASTTTPSCIISGKAVYKTEDSGVLSSISDIASLFADLGNILFGFTGGDDKDEYGINDLVDDQDGGKHVLNKTGHSYMCYCEKCHPEMYDEKGNPITKEALLYKALLSYEEQSKQQKALGNIYDNIKKQLGMSFDPVELLQSKDVKNMNDTEKGMLNKFILMLNQGKFLPDSKYYGDIPNIKSNNITSKEKSLHLTSKDFLFVKTSDADELNSSVIGLQNPFAKKVIDLYSSKYKKDTYVDTIKKYGYDANNDDVRNAYDGIFNKLDANVDPKKRLNIIHSYNSNHNADYYSAFSTTKSFSPFTTTDINLYPVTDKNGKPQFYLAEAHEGTHEVDEDMKANYEKKAIQGYKLNTDVVDIDGIRVNWKRYYTDKGYSISIDSKVRDVDAFRQKLQQVTQNNQQYNKDINKKRNKSRSKTPTDSRQYANPSSVNGTLQFNNGMNTPAPSLGRGSKGAVAGPMGISLPSIDLDVDLKKSKVKAKVKKPKNDIIDASISNDNSKNNTDKFSKYSNKFSIDDYITMDELKLFNGTNDSIAFTTEFMGVPVYGVNATDGTSYKSASLTSPVQTASNSISSTSQGFSTLGNPYRFNADKYKNYNKVSKLVNYVNNVQTGYSAFSNGKIKLNTFNNTKDRNTYWAKLGDDQFKNIYKIKTLTDFVKSVKEQGDSVKENPDLSEKDLQQGVVGDSSSDGSTDVEMAYTYSSDGKVVQVPLKTTELSKILELDNQTKALKQETDSLDSLVGQGSGLGSSFVSQLDPKYANVRFNTSKDTKYQTLGEAGCAPAVATMAINGYGNGTTMGEMTKDALRYKVKDDGTSADYFSDVFKKHGINSSYTNSVGDIKSNLKRGKSVVLLGQDKNNTSKSKSPFGPGSHYVLANGISDDGKTVYVNDPEAKRPNVAYNSKILQNTNMGITVGGGSLLNRYIGSGYKQETRPTSKIVHQNLCKFSPVTADELNQWLNGKLKRYNYTNSLLWNKGAVFITASKRTGLDPRYILAHACLESQWGTSPICRKKYNFFGLSAFDSSPYASADRFNSVDDGIIAGAEDIKRRYYIKHKQTTLYLMRHDPNGSHNYATDPDWHTKIASIMRGGPINTNPSYSKGSLSMASANKLEGSTTYTSSGVSSSGTVDDGSTTTSTKKKDGTYESFSSMISDAFSSMTEALFGQDADSTTSEKKSKKKSSKKKSKDSKKKTTKKSSSKKTTSKSKKKSGKGSELIDDYFDTIDDTESYKIQNPEKLLTGNGSGFVGSGFLDETQDAFSDLGSAIFNLKKKSSSSSSSLSTGSTKGLKLKKGYKKGFKSFVLSNKTGPLSSKIVAEAKKHLGKRYVYGAIGPNTFDCSGLCKYVYAKCGINLINRSSAAMASDGQGKSVKTATVGDLVFFGSPVHHVGIYIGNGKYIHAPKTGDVVKIADLTRRTDLVKIKHYTASGKGSMLPEDTVPTNSKIDKIKDTLSQYDRTNEENDKLNTYMESLYGSGSKAKAKSSKVPTKSIKVPDSSVSLSNSELVALLKLVVKSMGNIESNTNQLATIVNLLTTISKLKKKSGKGSETTSSSSSNNDISPTIINQSGGNNEDNDTSSLEILLRNLNDLASD